MNDFFKEINNWIRKSQIFNSIVTRLRRNSRRTIARSSSILNSKIPGLVSLGEGSLLSNVSISGSVNLGDNCAVFESALVGDISIGRFTTINANTKIKTGDFGVVIGKFCSIAPDCYIQNFNHNIRRLSTFNMQKNVFSQSNGSAADRDGSNSEDSVSKGKLIIGNDVWIGTKSVVVSGARIGDGAVIGANSLVNKDIPPYAIVGGSPAKILGFRFEEKVVEQLLRLQWWDWPLERIVDAKELFLQTLDSSKLSEIEKYAD